MECDDDEPEARSLSSDRLASSQGTKASMVTEELESLQSSITSLLQAVENKNRVTQHSRR
jgi:hypothetical protein